MDVALSDADTEELLSGIQPLNESPCSSLQSTPNKSYQTPKQAVKPTTSLSKTVTPNKLQNYLNKRLIVDSPGVSPIKYEPGWNGYNSAPPSAIAYHHHPRLLTGDSPQLPQANSLPSSPNLRFGTNTNINNNLATTEFKAQDIYEKVCASRSSEPITEDRFFGSPEKTSRPYDSKTQSLTTLSEKIKAHQNPRVIATVQVKSGERNKVTFVDDLPSFQSSSPSPARRLFIDNQDDSLQSILSKSTLPSAGQKKPTTSSSTSPSKDIVSSARRSISPLKFPRCCQEDKSSPQKRKTCPVKIISPDQEVEDMIGRSGTALKSLRSPSCSPARSPVPPVTLRSPDQQDYALSSPSGVNPGAICICKLPKCCCDTNGPGKDVAYVAIDLSASPENVATVAPRKREVSPSYMARSGSAPSAVTDAGSVSLDRYQHQYGSVQTAEPRAFVVRNNGELEQVDRPKTPEAPVETSQYLTSSPGVKAAEDTIKENGYNLQPEEYENVSSFDIAEMEGVRNHLQNMLKTSRQALRSPPGPRLCAMHQKQYEQHDQSEQQTECTSPCKHPVHDGPNHYLSHQLDESDVDLEDALGSWFGRHRHLQSENAFLTENKVIRESLEREKYKRQHCEKQIRDLQQRLLETQEQLAVSVSTEKKKDIMIEQLDKTLARVVEGWKKRESEKQSTMDKLRADREESDTKLLKQQQVSKDFQQDLEKTLNNLEAEQTKVGELEKFKVETLAQLDLDRAQLTEQLETESERANKFESEYLRTKEALERLEKQSEKFKQQMKDEKEGWLIQDKKYQNKIDEINASHERALTTEKERLDEQTKLAKGAKEVITSLQLELQQQRIELDTTSREKDSLKVELGLQEARMESSKRKLEADLRAEFDKTISDKHSEAHDRLLKRETELMEQHRKQIHEANSRHGEEMDEQIAKVMSDHRKQDINYKEQIRQLDESLERKEDELRQMKAAKTKAERQRDWLSRSQPLMSLRLPTAEELEAWDNERDIDCTDGVHCDSNDNDNNESELVNRLQSMMQVHCDEALNVLTHNRSPEKPSALNNQQPPIPVIMAPPVRQPNRQSDGYLLPTVTHSDESLFLPQNLNANDTYRQQLPEVRRNISPDFDEVSEIPVTDTASEATNYHKIPRYYSNGHLTDISSEYRNGYDLESRRHDRFPSAVRDESRPGLLLDSGIDDSSFQTNGHSSYNTMRAGLYAGTQASETRARHVCLQNGAGSYNRLRQPPDESHHLSSSDGMRYLRTNDPAHRVTSPAFQSGYHSRSSSTRDIIEDVHNDIPQVASLTGNYGYLNDCVKDHEVRQTELQQYIKTLLKQSPGSSVNGDVVDNSSNTSSTQYQQLPPSHSPPQQDNLTGGTQSQIQQKINSGKMEVEDILNCLKHLQDTGQIPMSSGAELAQQIHDVSNTAAPKNGRISNNQNNSNKSKSGMTIDRQSGRLVSTNHAPQYSQATEVARVKLYAGRKQPPVSIATKETISNQQRASTTKRTAAAATTRKQNPVWR